MAASEPIPETSRWLGAIRAQIQDTRILGLSPCPPVQLRASARRRSDGEPAITPLLPVSIQPLPHQRPPRYLTQNEVGRFFAAIGDLRDRALFALMYHHGLRVGEVPLLRRMDLDLDRARLLVRRLKGGAWSEQILFAGTAGLLREYVTGLPEAPDEPLFPGRAGPLRRRQIQSRFVRYRTLAGLPADRTSHSLRHSIATHLLDAGVSLEFVQDHLGHQSIRSTSIYARITDRHRAALFEQLERSPWIVHPGGGGSPPPETLHEPPAPEYRGPEP